MDRLQDAGVAFALPFVVWLVSFVVFAVQVVFLLLFETRIAAGILEKKPLDYILAVVIIVASSSYVQSVAAPLLASFYPTETEDSARASIIFILAGVSLLHSGVAFHYCVSHVTRFRGRSLLVFQQAIYDKDPIEVRRLWIRIFNLIGLTTMVLFGGLFVLVFSVVRVLGKVENTAIVLSYAAGYVILGLLLQPMRNMILRFPSNLVLVAKLNQVLAQSAKPRDVRRSLSPRKSDSNGWARKELLLVSRMFERLARQEDSSSGVDANHPIASIYRAVADEIRQYCGSPRSLDGPLPSALVATLKETQGFMITGDSAWRKRVVKRLKVFDADERPRALATTPATPGMARVLRTGGRSVDRGLVWIQDRSRAILIVVAIIATLLGVLPLEKLLGMGS